VHCCWYPRPPPPPHTHVTATIAAAAAMTREFAAHQQPIYLHVHNPVSRHIADRSVMQPPNHNICMHACMHTCMYVCMNAYVFIHFVCCCACATPMHGSSRLLECGETSETCNCRIGVQQISRQRYCMLYHNKYHPSWCHTLVAPPFPSFRRPLHRMAIYCKQPIAR